MTESPLQLVRDERAIQQENFHGESCRYAQWELDKGREGEQGGAQRVEGGVGSRGGNVRSVAEARQLQTASKALDRWRLVMEVHIHRTLLGTGRFHVDDLDCLDLPAEAFEVRGTLVNAVRASGVMRSTGVTRKVAHKAANARKAPIYEITPKGREKLREISGLDRGHVFGGSASVESGDQSGVGSPGSTKRDQPPPAVEVAADTGSPGQLFEVTEEKSMSPYSAEAA